MSKLALWHWHIEISSKCTLKCSRCARNEVPETLINTELTLDFFKQHFTPEFIVEKVEKLTFCGDDGDPIYAHDLIDVIKYFKSVKPVEIVIVTNGSHKKKEWWDELATVMTDIDEIHFSLDGWDQLSNEKYRVNCNWDSIVTGIRAMRNSPVFMRWATIAFSFNESYLNMMCNLADEHGFDTFQITKSTKFGKIYPSYPIIDTLQPTANLISHTGRFTREEISLSTRSKASYKNPLAETVVSEFANKPITPLCYVGNKGLYISSLGKLYPCCWVANRYNHNNEWQTLAFDLNNTPLLEALNSEFWTKRFTNFEWQECKTKCISRDDKSHYTDW